MPVPNYYLWFPTLVSFIASILGVLLTSYLREKGKNLATKADIGQITKIVEETKSNYSRQTELLRAELNTIVNVRNTMNEELRRAIFEFWDHTMLLMALCDSCRGEFEEERHEEIDPFMREIERIENELMLKHARLFFLLEDHALMDLSDELLANITKRHAKFALFIIKAKPWITAMGQMYNGPIEKWNEELNKKWWQSYLKCEQEYDKDVTEVEEKLESNLEEFKSKARALLLNGMRDKTPVIRA